MRSKSRISTRFDLEAVKPRRCDASLFKRVKQSILVDKRTARGVHDNRTFGKHRKTRRIHQICGLRRGRAVQGQKIRNPEQAFNRIVVNSALRLIR